MYGCLYNTMKWVQMALLGPRGLCDLPTTLYNSPLSTPLAYMDTTKIQKEQIQA